jgi:hypothetical protein
MISDPQKMVKYQRQNALTHSHEPKSKKHKLLLSSIEATRQQKKGLQLKRKLDFISNIFQLE